MKTMFKNQVGDTIIEVMIAIAIVTGVLGATFAISNRSIKATQANHERFQAQMFANQQAEWIKSYSVNNLNALLTNSASFCMSNATNLVFSPTNNPLCKAQSLYTITITPKQMWQYIDSGLSNTNNTFYIHVQWFSFSKSGQDQLELVYGI